MNSVLILYPKSEGSSFDMDYYTSTHMPLFADAVGEACQGWGVVATHGDEYHAVGWMMVSDMAQFGAAMKERGGPVMADVPNYTTVQPKLLTGDVVV